jgi:hypothetical protein
MPQSASKEKRGKVNVSHSRRDQTLKKGKENKLKEVNSEGL